MTNQYSFVKARVAERPRHGQERAHVAGMEGSAGVTASKARYTKKDRERALGKIEAFLESEAMRERVRALYARFYGDVEAQPDPADTETMDHLRTEGHRAFTFWAFFDADDGGEPMAALVLRARKLPPGESAYVAAMRAAPMRLYEVIALEPGRTITLRDVLAPESALVKVRERSASRSLRRGDVVATRVVDGLSGALELDGAFFLYEERQHARVIERARAELARLREAHPEADEQAHVRALGPTLHIEWRTR
jgi:hypothetical protein